MVCTCGTSTLCAMHPFTDWEMKRARSWRVRSDGSYYRPTQRCDCDRYELCELCVPGLKHVREYPAAHPEYDTDRTAEAQRRARELRAASYAAAGDHVRAALEVIEDYEVKSAAVPYFVQRGVRVGIKFVVETFRQSLWVPRVFREMKASVGPEDIDILFVRGLPLLGAASQYAGKSGDMSMPGEPARPYIYASADLIETEEEGVFVGGHESVHLLLPQADGQDGEHNANVVGACAVKSWRGEGPFFVGSVDYSDEGVFDGKGRVIQPVPVGAYLIDMGSGKITGVYKDERKRRGRESRRWPDWERVQL